MALAVKTESSESQSPSQFELSLNFFPSIFNLIAQLWKSKVLKFFEKKDAEYVQELQNQTQKDIQEIIIGFYNLPDRLDNATETATETTERLEQFKDALVSHREAMEQVQKGDPTSQNLLSEYTEALENLNTACEGYAQGANELSEFIEANQAVMERSLTITQDLARAHFETLMKNQDLHKSAQQAARDLDIVHQEMQQMEEDILEGTPDGSIFDDKVVEIFIRLSEMLDKIRVLPPEPKSYRESRQLNFSGGLTRVEVPSSGSPKRLQHLGDSNDAV